MSWVIYQIFNPYGRILWYTCDKVGGQWSDLSIDRRARVGYTTG
ncbi:hypothetical protein SAMN05421504_107224 [Amycolatopsis xylanica]|uniref:Uncharacterized protein n=1 Tax=Amycolatopsis xylanica TaxID=589385 RepID=A0A1H3NBS1_9PSEU|nr:hypothetical protein SAMN05421504_107224 [Amycolatopsis xylanica]